MKKRIRKKTHRGEFTEFGFSIEVTFNTNLSHEDFDSFINAFLDEAVQQNYLSCGGGGDPAKVQFFVAQATKEAMTDADREKVSAWCKARKEVKAVTAGPLEDAWR